MIDSKKAAEIVKENIGLDVEHVYKSGNVFLFKFNQKSFGSIIAVDENGQLKKMSALEKETIDLLKLAKLEW